MELINIIDNYISKDIAPELIILFILFASVVYALSQLNAIYDFIDKFNSRESTKLRELLTNDNISSEAKEILRDKLDLLAYQKATGIKSKDIHLQKRIIEYYKLAEGRLKYSDFNRAFLFLEVDRDGNLYIRKHSKIEKFFQIFWNISSTIVFILIYLLLAILIFAPIPTRMQLGILLYTICLFVIFFLFISQTYSLPAAKKIRDEVEKNPFIIQHKIRRKKIKENKIVEIEKFKQLRPYGLCKGEFTVPDNFDDPLPEDILNSFEGK